MLTVSTNYSTAISQTLTQPGFLVKVGWATPKYFSSRGDVSFTVPGESASSLFVSTPITVSAINTDVTAKSTGSLTIGIDINDPLKVTQYALAAEYGFADTPIDIWLYDNYNLYSLKWAIVSGTVHLLNSPDSAANSITEDIDIRADILADDWTPSSVGNFIAKRQSAGQASFRFAHTTTGYLYFESSSNGTALSGHSSTVPHNFIDGTRHWVRVKRIALTGVVTFYTSTDGLTWTILGAPVTGTVGDIFNSTSPIEIGTVLDGTTEPFVGKIYKIQVYNGIPDTPYALFNSLSGGYITTPDTTVNSIADDIEITVAAALDDYSAAFQVLLAKWTTTGNQRAYLFGIASNNIYFYVSSNGTASANVSQPISLIAGTLYYFKVTRTKSSGATNFYYSTDGVTFTLIGTTQTLSAGVSMYGSSTAQVSIGAYDTGGISGMVKGKVYSAKILNGVDGQKVVDFNLTGITNSPATITSSTTGEVWTLNGSSKIGGNLAIDFNAQDATVGSGPFTSTITGETWTISGSFGGASYQQNASTNELNTGDVVKIFKGIGDSVTMNALELTTTLIPVNLISSVSPRIRINPRNGFNYIQPKGTVINWGTDRFTLE